MHIRHFNLGTMLHCLEIEQKRSINAAARARDISQPSLSRSVRAMEDALGVPLFRRTASGVEPTPYGDTLLFHTRIVQSELQRCLHDIEERRKSGRATLQVGATPGVVGWLVTPAVMDLLRADEEVNVGLQEGLPDDLWSSLQRGAIDLCVSTPFPSAPADAPAGLPLLREPTRVVAGAAHPLARRKRVTLSDLAGLRWVLPTGAQGWQQRFEEEFRAAGLQVPGRIFATNSYLALRQMLTQTDAVALLPLDYVRADLRARALRVLPVAHRFAEMEYRVYAKREDQLPALAARLIEHLRARVAVRPVPTGYAVRT